jgi:hypothetical protein
MPSSERMEKFYLKNMLSEKFYVLGARALKIQIILSVFGARVVIAHQTELPFLSLKL